jgi:ankyrin repeat protein
MEAYVVLSNEICARLRNGEIEDLEVLLATYCASFDGTPLPEVKLDAGRTLLHAALEQRPTEEFLNLLSQVLSPEVYSTADKFGLLPLHAAIHHCNSFSVICAVAMANPSAVDALDKEGDTPIDLLFNAFEDSSDFIMSEEEVSKLIDALLDMWPEAVKSTNRDGHNLLHRAVKRNAFHLPTLQSLVVRRPEMIFDRDLTRGSTPIHFACIHDDDKAHERLLVVLNACQEPREKLFSMRNGLGGVPLHCASHFDAHERVIEIIVEAYPEGLQVKSNDGDTPLESFAEYHHEFFEEMLGAEEPDMENAESVMNSIDAFFSMRPANFPIVHAALMEEGCPIEIIRFLLLGNRHREDIWALDENGNLPLHIACSRTPREEHLPQYRGLLTKLLKEYPAGASQRNHQQLLPLTVMHRAGHKWNELVLVLAKYPRAVIDLGLNEYSFCHFISKLSESNVCALFELIQGAPDRFQAVN